MVMVIESSISEELYFFIRSKEELGIENKFEIDGIIVGFSGYK